ncbi:MAG: hypothetical protein HP060_01395 [Opitutales bacterium]|nr:hypothetical protein [Opitutales bacterium]
MRLLNLLTGLLRRIFGTDTSGDIARVRVFEGADGRWRFQTIDGTITWGSYPTRADAVRVAKEYNFFEVID